jgi:putative endonuclease
MTNNSNKVLYTGITNDIQKRVNQHKNNISKNFFTCRYNISKLVYFEQVENVYAVISREKQIKAGSRQRKVNLIEKLNPCWNDLCGFINGK